MHFRSFLETTYYHGTSATNAASIIKNGIDPKQYRSGLFRGFYLTPSLNYFDFHKPEAILKIEIDDSEIMDVKDVSEQDLAEEDPHYRSMSYGWRNTLIERIARSRGFFGVKNGNEVILFDPRAIKSITQIQ